MFKPQVVLLTLLISMAFSSAWCWAQVTIELHDGFAIEIAKPDEVEQFDGQNMPKSFSITFPDDGGEEGADSLDFVLVMPATTEIEEFKLTVDKPFYIATDVLSIEQVIQFDDFFRSTPNSARHEQYIDEQLDIFGEYMARAPDASKQYRGYLADRQKPHRIEHFQEVNLILVRASARIGQIVRAPSLAEYFVAMKGGSGKRFWWGDDWDRSQANLPPMPEADTTHPDPDAWNRIEKVKAGKPNPFGLYHMIGNIGQALFPTMKERHELMNYFSEGNPGWELKKRESEADDFPFDAYYSRVQFAIAPHDFIVAGGTALMSPWGVEYRATSLSYTVIGQSPDFVGIRPVLPYESAEGLGLFSKP